MGGYKFRGLTQLGNIDEIGVTATVTFSPGNEGWGFCGLKLKKVYTSNIFNHVESILHSS